MISHWLATKSWNFNIWHSEYIDISKFYVQNIEILSFDILKKIHDSPLQILKCLKILNTN